MPFVELFHGARCKPRRLHAALPLEVADGGRPQRAGAGSALAPNLPARCFDVAEDEDGSYILNANDLCAAPLLGELVARRASPA